MNDLEELSARIAADPADARLHHERAWLHGKARRWREAMADFDAAVALDPANPIHWRDRGHLQGHLGHIGLAERDFRHAFELDPGAALAFALLGRAYRSWHELPFALACFDRAIDLDPGEAKYHVDRARVLAEAGHLPRALADFDAAIRLDPARADSFYQRAAALLYENPDVRAPEALPDLDAAIRLDPAATWYRHARGPILYGLGRYAAAAADFASLDLPHMYSMWKHGAAQVAVWHFLAGLHLGRPDEGERFARAFLAWYEGSVTADDHHGPFGLRWDWPVPLLRHLLGGVDEARIRAEYRRILAEAEPYVAETAAEQLLEFEFVRAEVALARGHATEARPHWQLARGLPPRHPMRWVADLRLDGPGQPAEVAREHR